jgi:adenylosuccinate lyase
MMGRTHGVHAEPLTLGVKLANHYDEVRRSRERLQAAAQEVAVGQISGAVGTHASVAPEVEEHVCRGLGLAIAPAATQVLARDRHAAFVSAMAILAAVLERLATTIRLLQITEVDEAEEPFSERQKGSSAMPHKRNPILCERICGIARVLRGHSMTALDNVALWHERDISHSSAERVILPDACALTAYALRLSTRVVTGLRVKPENMRAHVNAFGGVVFSQRVLGALILEAGWPRERAYRAVQSLAQRARDGEAGFDELVASDPEVSAALDDEQLQEAFDVHAYLHHIDDTYARLGLSTTAALPESEAAAPPQLAVEAGLGGGRL